MAHEDGAWFAPKRIGYGSGLPIAWQGWAVLLVYVAAVAVAAMLLIQRSIWAYVGVVAVLTGVMVLIVRAKTRGGWRRPKGGETD